MIRPVNISNVYVDGAAMMAIIPIPIVGKSFTRIPSDSLCMLISGLAGTAVSDYSQGCIPHTSFKELSGADSPLLDTPDSLFAWCVTLSPAHTTFGRRH